MSDSMRPSIREEMAEQRSIIAALQKENAKLRDALEYYADPDWYVPRQMGYDPGVINDGGDRARAALTPSAAPGEADCSICRQPGCTGDHACE